jgi:hypothetical protein
MSQPDDDVRRLASEETTRVLDLAEERHRQQQRRGETLTLGDSIELYRRSDQLGPLGQFILEAVAETLVADWLHLPVRRLTRPMIVGRAAALHMAGDDDACRWFLQAMRGVLGHVTARHPELGLPRIDQMRVEFGPLNLRLQ